MAWTDAQRDEVARILEQIAEEGMDHPRNLDAALDAIQSTVERPDPDLQAAARRVDEWLPRYMINARWSLGPIGLELQAQSGSERITKFIGWGELEQSYHADRLLMNTESAALAGLSN